MAKGDCIGWTDADAVYLDLTAAYRVPQVSCRDVGESIPVTEQTLKKRMHERGLLASVDRTRQTLTIRRKINGTSRDVLHLLRATILPEGEDSSDDLETVIQ